MARVSRESDGPPVLEAFAFDRTHGGVEHGQSLKALCRQHEIKSVACSMLMPPNAYSLLLVEAPDVPAEELKAAMRWRIKDLIDFHIDDAVVDVFDIPSHKGATGSRMSYVVAARLSEVRSRIAASEAAGVDLRVIDVQELALRNIAALLPEDERGVALIYMTWDWGLILLTRQGELHLARRFASGLDASGGRNPPSPQLLTRFQENLVVEIQRSLDYYESHYTQSRISRLVVAPTPVPMAGLTEFLGQQLGLAVRDMDLNTLLDSERPLPPELQCHLLPLVGAALRHEEVVL